MPVSRSEAWVQVAELDEKDRIRFTAEFCRIMGELGWEGKAFIGHLLGLWFDPFDGLVKSQKTPFFVIPAEAGIQ